MSQVEVSQRLVEEGGTLVLLGMPARTLFGIDVNFWNVGDRFRGVKMIPPGLHFVYFSAVSPQGDTAPRTGFFHFFQPKEVLVRHYDPQAEDLKVEEANVDEVERIRTNLRQLDQFLGPYPLDSWKKWISLTQYVEEVELRRMLPLSGRVCSAPELIPVAGFRSSRKHRHTHTTPTQPHTAIDTPHTTTDTPQHTGPLETHTQPRTPPHTTTNTTSDPETTPQNTTQPLTDTPHTTTDDSQPPSSPKTAPQPPTTPNITTEATATPHTTTKTSEESQPQTHTSQPPPAPQLPEMRPKEGSTFRFTEPPTRAYREGATPSEVTKYSLDSSYSLRCMMEQAGSVGGVLAELQASFVVFLVGEVEVGWTQWRSLVEQLCRAEEVLVEQPDLYLKLLSVLHYQVNEIPADLFTDIVESTNFLAASLTTLFANVEDNSSRLPTPLVLKAQRFKQHIMHKFEWDLTLGDEGEDAPVVVEMN